MHLFVEKQFLMLKPAMDDKYKSTWKPIYDISLSSVIKQQREIKWKKKNWNVEALKNATVFFGLIKPMVQILKYLFLILFLCLSAEFFKNMGSNDCVHTE